MNSVVEFIGNNISVFDLSVVLIVIYTMVRCAAKGFMLSLLSFSQWLISLVITIVLVPKLNPWVENYIQSKFITDVALGVFIFIVSIFFIINLSKGISSLITWSGLGVVDKTFGLVFGVFKGYVICVCIFSLSSWFYPYQKWSIQTDNSYTFSIIENGSKFLIKELPNSKDYLDNTEEKIKDI